MISPLVLDPSSLALWYSPGSLSMALEEDLANETFQLANGPDPASVAAVLSKVSDEKRRYRAMNLASSIWHEKRHFLDLLLTNYGLFHVRQFLELYINMPNLLGQFATTGKELVLPIDAVEDPVRRRTLRIDPNVPNLREVARAIASRQNLLREDRRPVAKQDMRVSFGGEAQFEALAYTHQLGSASAIFGLEGQLSAHLDFNLGKKVNYKYRWGEMLLRGAGVAEVGNTNGIDWVDLRALSPVMYASLMIRSYGAEQTIGEHAFSGTPSHRLSRILVALSKRGPYKGLSVDDYWHLTNEVCRNEFGRTAMEEVDQDFIEEAAWIEKIDKSEIAIPPVMLIYKEMHALRGKLIDILKHSPSLVLNSDDYATDLVGRLQPITIIAHPGGAFGEVPEGFDRVLGYRDREYSKIAWWWAASPRPDGPRDLGFRHRKEWIRIASDLAPLAKLLINGRSHALLLPPELANGEAFLETQGIKFRFDPFFAKPRVSLDDVESYWHLTSRDAATCDWCAATVMRPGGHFVSPWFFRGTPEREKACIDHLGGNLVAARLFFKDWSGWVVCDVCFNELNAL